MKIVLNKEYELVIADTFKRRLLGLIGKSNITEVYLFPKCNMIHTFFMKEAIDVIGTDKNKTIVKVIKRVKPNRIVIIKEADQIYECPKNSTNGIEKIIIK